MIYATAQMQKTIIYPASFASKPRNEKAAPAFSEYVKSHPAPLLIRNEPIPPAIPPIPVIVAIADFGNMSPTVEKRFADHA